ncbi:hypothetical protein GMAR_ORF58 [Golden Marseillevirus]|uniref:hypothetical protein n=1 Tax=Golden Marseillevirus TaxID=1720526 RepID=UPI000877AAE2|nr:hypothetical protein GMAR_ORF58 [Golden Marseillevirus]ALX27433.1 hypothetical protein GMAR_ORF58 [Golden Marseillevirus]
MMTETRTEIQKNLYLGNLNALYQISTLPEKEQKKWCTVTILSKEELDSLPFAKPQYTFRGLIIRADDSPSVNLSEVFQQVADFIEFGLKNGKNVLVHCMMGISRSATCVIAYLMLKQGMTLKDALSFVRKRRNCVSPNPGFIKQLQNVGESKTPRSQALSRNWSFVPV